MDNVNPLKTVRRRTLLPAGYYTARLVDILNKKGKDKEGKEVDKIAFKFSIEGKQGSGDVFRYFYPSLDPNSKLIQFVRALNPEAFTDDVIGDPDAIWVLLKTLLGSQYKAFVSVNGEWNNLENLMPLGEPAPRDNLATVAPITDDIPF
jgi:hypothetical protein